MVVQNNSLYKYARCVGIVSLWLVVFLKNRHLKGKAPSLKKIQRCDFLLDPKA